MTAVHEKRMIEADYSYVLTNYSIRWSGVLCCVVLCFVVCYEVVRVQIFHSAVRMHAQYLQ